MEGCNVEMGFSMHFGSLGFAKGESQTALLNPFASKGDLDNMFANRPPFFDVPTSRHFGVCIVSDFVLTAKMGQYLVCHVVGSCFEM